jgi:hypothetical protein
VGPTILPWILISLIAVGATGYGVHRYLANPGVPRLEIHLNTKNSSPEVDRVPINVQVRFIKTIRDGQFDLDTDGHNLITSRRKRNG